MYPGLALPNAAVGVEVVAVHGGQLPNSQLNLKVGPSLDKITTIKKADKLREAELGNL